MAAIANKDHRLIWIDLEMTGLDTDRDSILEIATVVTDANLEVLAEGPEFAIAHPLSALEAMDEWNRNQHRKSGLWQRVLDQSVPMAHAEEQTLDFLGRWVSAGASPMCGNSICQDRRFLHRLMPRLEKHFHYRNLDVSTLKELARRWAPEVMSGFGKESAHTALSDVRDSIAEISPFSPVGGMVAAARLMILKRMTPAYAAGSVAADATTEAMAQVGFLAFGLGMGLTQFRNLDGARPFPLSMLASLHPAVPVMPPRVTPRNGWRR